MLLCDGFGGWIIVRVFGGGGDCLFGGDGCFCCLGLGVGGLFEVDFVFVCWK